MDAACQDPVLLYQQSSYDDEFFLQPNNDNDNHPDLTYFDVWPAQSGPQNCQLANYSISQSPFVNTAYLESFENTPPISFIAPSQTELMSSSQLPTGLVDTGMFFEHERSQPRITPASKNPRAKPGLVTRFAPSSTHLRIDADEEPGQAPGIPASRNSAGARAQAHVAPADQVPLTETRSEKKGGQSDSSEDEYSATLKAKHNHSVIERRYRDNLNGKINQLHSILQVTEANSPLMRFSAQPSDPGRMVRKSEIMTKALHYVHRSEHESRHMRHEIQRLREQVQNLEKLIKCEDCPLLQSMRRVDFNKTPC